MERTVSITRIAEADLPRVAVLALYVNDGNASAIAFYRSQGFAIAATEVVHMGPYELNDHVMTRPLT